MSVIDEVLQANTKFVEHYAARELPLRPARRLAIVACMDYRINVEEVLGLKNGDANIIRNAGGIITEDALRSLIVSHHFLGVQEIMIINHTDCGMLKFKEKELISKLQQLSGTATVTPSHFHTFSNLDQNVRTQMQRLRSHPWIPAQLIVRGFVYNVKTGLLNEVSN
ncbi:MAG: carbonic anhydrase [Chloroflexota bacterium]|nr:carbonic anhydrase [Chloroflexota bacterium]